MSERRGRGVGSERVVLEGEEEEDEGEEEGRTGHWRKS